MWKELRGIEVIWGLDKNSGQSRRLKPQIIARHSGTTEVVPFQRISRLPPGDCSYDQEGFFACDY